MTELQIQFARDFEDKYEAYKAKLSGESITASKKLSTKNTSRFPHKLPSGTKWEDFIIKFLSNDRVLIRVRDKSEELDYQAMGFNDKRNGKPDSQWALLRILAKSNGELSWSDQNANDNFKKVKERLTSKLQSYFSIDYDPFHPYSEAKSYKIKLTLMPAEDVQGDNEAKLGLSEEIQDMFEDLTAGDK